MNDRTEYLVPLEDAIARLAVVEDYDDGNGPRPCVHTFVSSGFGLLGAHWGLTEVRAAFERWGVEESGERAKAMSHGLAIVERNPGEAERAVFFETKPVEASA